MDEQPVQLGDSRTPLPRTRRVDYEYGWAGTAFMFCEALSFWLRAMARKRRTKADGAGEVAGLLEGRYANCEHPRVRQPQQPNTRTPGAFYEASCAGAGVGQASRCTPKHGSWLNIAENELRIRQRQRHRRLGDTLQAEAWSVDVNERQRRVDWES